MFTDIAGYTALMQQDEESALAVRTHHREALETAVAPHGGKILQFLGDGSLTVFSSVVEAAKAAIEIQRLLALPPAVPLRIGIHHGDIADDAQGVYGDSVNLAARLQSLAPPGAILVSGSAHDEIKNQKALPAVFLGEFTLKNVTHAVPVYSLAAPGLHVPSATEMRNAAVRAGARAVTPVHPAGKSSSALLERVREALFPDFEVERELSAGGMGVVFLARDPTLERAVAIKVMRPELATANAVARFLREARILARIRHPNIVPVHRAGDVDGLPFYVMDYLKGDTLADRLLAGPLSPAEVGQLASALLNGLEAVHTAGVVHRDIKPANIFISGDATVIVDFGIARVPATTTERNSTEHNVGTPGYMPPEQAAGETATERTDLYAVGMVLYEALTGRRWSVLEDVRKADWSGVPSTWREPLRRALAWSPAGRWSDAAAFRAGISQKRVRPRARRYMWTALIALPVISASVIGIRIILKPPLPLTADIAVLPFDAADGKTGEMLSNLVTRHLELVPRLTVREYRVAHSWWERQKHSADNAGRELAVRFIVRATVMAGAGDTLRADLACTRDSGSALPCSLISGKVSDLSGFADAITIEILKHTRPELQQHALRGTLSANHEAVMDFVAAELSAIANDWASAQLSYQSALDKDPSFSKARIGLFNAQRWLAARRTGIDPADELRRVNMSGLSEVDSLIVAAHLARSGLERLRLFERAAGADRRNAFAFVLLGEELFHRGPLSGRSARDAVDQLDMAIKNDPSLAPAYHLLTWHYIRRGDRETASIQLERFRTNSQPGMDYELFNHAWTERFDSAAARGSRKRLFSQKDRSELETLGMARMGLAFGLPETQVYLSELLLTNPFAARTDSANALFGRALAFFALGRWQDGLQSLDSAALLDGKREAKLQAAQWRVLPAALGLVAVDSATREHGVSMLQELVAGDSIGSRAAWSLAMHSALMNDPATATTWRNRMKAHIAVLDRSTDGSAGGLAALDMLIAAALTANNDTSRALAMSGQVLDFDVHSRHTDPFARSALHILRGKWFANDDSAIAAWTWAENVDWVGWLEGPPQAAEIDWVLSPYASILRTQRGERDCFHVNLPLRWWHHPDPALDTLRQAAERLATTTACRT
jgi:serine/threonine protein kinase